MTTETETPTLIAKAVSLAPPAEDKNPLDEPAQQASPEASFLDDEEDDDETFLSEDTQSEDEEEDTFAFIEIFKKECLACSYLVPFATKKYKSCHFSSGNENCPAASAKIVVRIPLEKISTSFLAAEAQGDHARLAKLHALLATKEPWYQERVAEHLAATRLERAARSER